MPHCQRGGRGCGLRSRSPGASGVDVISLALGAADRYVVSYPMPTPGLYTFRIRARGETMYGMPFEREQTLTAVAVPGGDHWSPNDPPRDVLCELLDCIRPRGAISGETLRRLEAMGHQPRRGVEVPRQAVPNQSRGANEKKALRSGRARRSARAQVLQPEESDSGSAERPAQQIAKPRISAKGIQARIVWAIDV